MATFKNLKNVIIILVLGLIIWVATNALQSKHKDTFLNQETKAPHATTSIGGGYSYDEQTIYFDNTPIAEITSSYSNPLFSAAAYLASLLPENNNKAIDAIIASYYDFNLFYGSTNADTLFTVENKEKIFRTFLSSFKETSYEGVSLLDPVFRIAFVEQGSQASKVFFPSMTLPGIGGEAIGKKYTDADTVLVYGKYRTQSNVGASVRDCKETAVVIDKFVFEKINNQWKMTEAYLRYDTWPEIESEETCTVTNEGRDMPYRIGLI